MKYRLTLENNYTLIYPSSITSACDYNIKIKNHKEMTLEQQETLLNTLKVRFEQHTNRHQGMDWANVEAKLKTAPQKLGSLYQMEETGGEPDVVGFDKKTG